MSNRDIPKGGRPSDFDENDPDPFDIQYRLTGSDENDFERFCRHYWGVQRRYNDLTIKACAGLNKLRPEDDRLKYPRYCEQVMCPGCWHKTQKSLLTRASKVDAPYWYVRVTPMQRIGVPYDPAIMTRFKAHTTRYTPIAWVVAPEDGPDVGIEDHPDVVWYKYVGLFTSDKPVREWGQKTNPINRFEFDNVHDAITEWNYWTPHPAPLLQYGEDTFQETMRFIQTLGHQRWVQRTVDHAVRSRGLDGRILRSK